MIGLGGKEFIKERFNKFDLLIVIISILEFQNDEGPGIFSSLRAFRLFKLFRLFRVGDLRILLDSITFTLSTISDYVILLLLFIFVFALMGMSFFAGKVKFDEVSDQVVPLGENDMPIGGVSPRTNFDEIVWAIITIFEVLMGEAWNEIMYGCIRSVGSLASVYFIALVVGGNIIMLNLFLAILLGNFDKARNFQQKKKVFEAFKEIIYSGKTLNETLDVILGDMSIHVKTKILKWDLNEVAKLHTKGDTKIAQGLMEDGANFYSLSASNVESIPVMIEKKARRSEHDIFSNKSHKTPSQSSKMPTIEEEGS